MGQHATSLINCADKALYQAKHSGRNCACKYQPDADAEAAGKERGGLIVVKPL